MKAHVELLRFLGMPAVIASDVMHRLLRSLERVAMSGASVLIQGESGSGKELVARAIHHLSMRASKPWVDVSCAALPDLLMESELFGYEKGAFSGADSGKMGLFELANTGTIFLDEIGELDPRMQVKLLRVLDGAPYYRLGGTRKVSVDVRVIAATNRNLVRAVEEGRFRGDLFHRLSQIDVEVPPLRERLDDIVPLAEYFLEQQNPKLRLTDEAARVLRSHHWPGNVRELRNVMTKVAVMTCENEIRADHLSIQGAKPPRTEFGAPMQAPVGADLDSLERQTIFRVLEQTGGHQQRAANLLGISRRTLSRKLKAYASETGAVQYAC